MNSRLPFAVAQMTLGSRALLSIVVPAYNEVEVLPLCVARLREVLRTLDLSHEIVIVDDGSTDGTGDLVAAWAVSTPDIKLVRLARNYGKEAALTAGLEHAEGAAAIVLDADLQDPPELIPQMVQAWQAGADVVAMRRRSRAGESWAKRTSAYLFYRLLNRLSEVDIPADTGDFRLLSRRALTALAELPERNRYMKGLFAWIGLPTVTLLYDRACRAAGISKWGYTRLLGLAFEGITSFSIRPLRWAMGVGAAVASLGAGYGLYIVIKTTMLGEVVQGYPSLMALMTLLGGVQLLTLGVLGEYVGKSYLEAKQRPVYQVRDVVRAPAPVAAVSSLTSPLSGTPPGGIATTLTMPAWMGDSHG